MELWIRSQDKLKLVQVNFIYVVEEEKGYVIYGGGPEIGCYETKQRVLQILDDIQQFKDTSSDEKMTYIMPQE